MSRKVRPVRVVEGTELSPPFANASPVTVSVLTPSFNQVRWLRKCLDSVYEQTLSSYEHIVADAGSTDGSGQLLAARSRADPRLTYWSRGDRGQSDALNQAWRASTGEFVAWVNSDDALFAPTVLADVVDFFRHNPDVDVVYGHVALVDEDDRLLQHLWVPPWNPTLFRHFGFLHQPGVFFRRRILEAIGFVNDAYHYAMDGELWARLADQGADFRRLNRTLAVDRHQRLRKSVVGQDQANAEHRELESLYSLPRGLAHQAVGLAVRLAARPAGALALARTPETPLFTREPLRVEIRRQLLQRRSSMGYSKADDGGVA